MRWNRSTLGGALLATYLYTAAYAQEGVREQVVAHYRRAEAALAGGNGKEAATEFSAILKVDPTNAEANANLGVIAYKEGDFARAKNFFEEAVKRNPSLWDAKAFLGLSEMRTGENKNGDALLEEAYPHTQNPGVRMEAGIAIVRFHEEDKSLAQVIPVLDDLQHRAPDNPEILYVAYRAYSELASESLRTLSKVAPDSGHVHQVLAEAAFTQDDFGTAIAQFRQAGQADPNLPGIHYQLGLALLTNSQDASARQEAQQEFAAELKHDPSDFRSVYELGEIARLDAKPDEAAGLYAQALRLRPDFADAEIGIGRVLEDQGKPEEALAHLQQASRLDPDSEAAHYRLARVDRRLGRTREAETEMSVFKKLHDANDTRKPGSADMGGAKE